MDALEVIFTRRSARRFSAQKVSDEDIETLLKAAMNAPSARNEQPWHFLVVTERELLDKLAVVHPHAKMCIQAQAAIIPCVNPSSYTNDAPYWVQDLSAATENILLAARALNLGAVWVGVYPREGRIKDLQELFNLPQGIIPFCIIPIGYTDVKQEAVDRYQKDRVRYNKWD